MASESSPAPRLLSDTELAELLNECWSEGTKSGRLGERFMKHIAALSARLAKSEKDLATARTVNKAMSRCITSIGDAVQGVAGYPEGGG